jgi:hypothetical protein
VELDIEMRQQLVAGAIMTRPAALSPILQKILALAREVANELRIAA